jgi:hypothetical protein
LSFRKLPFFTGDISVPPGSGDIPIPPFHPWWVTPLPALDIAIPAG